MAHLPKNHVLRPFYRILALAAGVYCLIFGIVGALRTHGHSIFAQVPVRALGLRTNLAFALLSVLVGLVVIGATAVGRNVDRNVNIVLGPGFIVMGLAMMTVMRTSANVLNFGMSTCVVSFVIGLALFAGGLYGEEAPPEQALAEEQHRRGTVHRAPMVP
jgi:hypothetical protein